MNEAEKRNKHETETETDNGEAAAAAEEESAPAEQAEAGNSAADEVEADEVEADEVEAEDGDAIAKLETEVGQLKDSLLRAMAEMENLRRRSQREKEDALKYAPGTLAKALLPVADNLRRALDSLPEEARGEEKLAPLISGIEMTEKELQSAFAKNGIERIDPMGEKMDPNWHEAMFEVPDAEKPAGTVVQVVEVGYRLQDRLLRPARVGVSRKP